MPAILSKPSSSPLVPTSSFPNFLHECYDFAFKKHYKATKYSLIALALSLSALVFGSGFKLYSTIKQSRKRSLSSLHSTAVAHDSKPSAEKPKQDSPTSASSFVTSFVTKVYKLCVIAFTKKPSNLQKDEFSGKVLAMSASLVALIIIQSLVTRKANLVSGDMMEYLIAQKKSHFFYSVAKFSLFLVIQSMIGPSVKYLVELIALYMRRNLTMHVHDKYFSNMAYYKVNNLDKRVGAADQRITQDIDVFCNRLAELFTDMLHPTFELILYSIELVRLLGPYALMSVVLYLSFAIFVLSKVSPNFTKISAQVQNMEGNFRAMHNRASVFSELIAFYGGEKTERTKIENYFEKLTEYSSYVIGRNFSFGVVNDFFTKYFPHSFTTLIIGMPVFFGRLRFLKGDALMGKLRYIIAVITLEFYALGNVIELFRKLLRLGGMAQRVATLYAVLNEIKHGNSKNINFQKHHEGEIVEADEIRFDNVIIKTPDNITLARNLSFHVGKNEHIVISGSNGSGKSSLFRVLGALWPLHSGIIYKPQANGSHARGLHNDIFYLPQKPYNIKGSLRSQIIYPDSTLKEGWTDGKLEELLNDFGIGYLCKRSSKGFDYVHDWDSLSRGEQQKLAMVRLFYHKPRYAILDECTSCITADDENRLYRKCTSHEITCITISHRPALEKYHTQRLVFNGKGGWVWQQIKHGGESGVDEESSSSEITEPIYELKGMDLSIRDDIKDE
ncbi:hypothetical protein C9374_009235 [Naegleria lovaniensis]|uniref:ABC transporter n=1 Tax=Naegleria lovaniensis TaxID=51637 RepID=A0AA88KK01_NAELO|nr:uncharacterized protein C9374_009235 [Naegleria lovaniensis]KAG2377324.1 hypothetical protein C9374_009235 [Naegleria lovaniensis]